MRAIILLFAFCFAGCAAKLTKNSLLSGDYDAAINRATEALRRDRAAKSKQEFVYMLEEAFAKAKERDERNIIFFEKEGHPSTIEKLYNTYVQLDNRQEVIRPLLPLVLLKENRNANFPFEDYSNPLLKYKGLYTEQLYQEALHLLIGNHDKLDARVAYSKLSIINQLYPGYKDISTLTERAVAQGTDFVLVNVKNEAGVVIPERLENDLLDFGTLGLNNQWTVYHNKKKPATSYDYGITLNFVQILISPDQVKEREFLAERELKEGRKQLLDRQGNAVRDSTGAVIMIDDIKLVKATVNEFRQSKSCQVTAKVQYLDLKENQLLEAFPLTSEFIFENVYAVCRGDQRAVEDNYKKLFKNRVVPFPTNEQMAVDTGEDLKAKLKNIIANNRNR